PYAYTLDRRRSRRCRHRPESGSPRATAAPETTRQRPRRHSPVREPGTLEEVARLAREWFTENLVERHTDDHRQQAPRVYRCFYVGRETSATISAVFSRLWLRVAISACEIIPVSWPSLPTIG